MKQYRIAILGKWQSYLSYFLMGSMQGVFLNGGLAKDISLENRDMSNIWDQINFFKPHAILCHTIFDRLPGREQLFVILKKAKKFGVKIFYHAGDARPTPRHPHDISGFIDYALINHWPPMPEYSTWNIPCFHWPYMALNQDEIGKVSGIYKCDLAFAGSLASNQHHAPRSQFIRNLRDRLISITTFPTQESGNTRFQTPELAVSAKGVLGFQMGLDMPGYQDVRIWQYCGAGALYFHDKHPVVERFFRDGVHYVGFERDNIEDFVNKYNFYMENPEAANKIRQQSFEYCQKYHSSKERIKQVINILEGKEIYIWELDDQGSPQKRIM